MENRCKDCIWAVNEQADPTDEECTRCMENDYLEYYNKYAVENR